MTNLATQPSTSRRPEIWQVLMAVGFLIWVAMEIIHRGSRSTDHSVSPVTITFTILQLITGLLILQGACEALVQSVEHLGARLRWDPFVAGTIAEMLATLPA